MSASRRIAVDMEATRLVFVMLKGAKPMRKVAIPITDTTSWHAFESQVKNKLRIRAIQAMTMAAVCCPLSCPCLSSTLGYAMTVPTDLPGTIFNLAPWVFEFVCFGLVNSVVLQTGEVVTSLSQLQDIDQLHVIEAADLPVLSQTPQVTARQHSGMEILSAANGMSGALPQSSAAAARPDDDGNAKYIKKKGVLHSFLSGFRQGSLLPITTRDAELPGPRRPRRRSRILTLRNLTAALCAVLLMLWLFRVYYQSAGTATLSARQHVAPDGRGGVDPTPPVVVTKPPKKRTPSPGTGRPATDPTVTSPDETQPGEREKAPVREKALGRQGEGLAQADDDADAQAGGAVNAD